MPEKSNRSEAKPVGATIRATRTCSRQAPTRCKSPAFRKITAGASAFRSDGSGSVRMPNMLPALPKRTTRSLMLPSFYPSRSFVPRQMTGDGLDHLMGKHHGAVALLHLDPG